MNDLTGKCVNVVLAVEMGRGMDFLEHPIKIVANFNGRPLESDLVQPAECPLFNTELVWEIEKKELRRVRSAKSSLRVEIQIIDEKQRRDMVGFILLSPRCASIVPFESKIEIPFKWQKLLGVAAGNKINHPELYLSLTIRDIDINPAEVTILSSEDSEEPIEEVIEKDGETITLRYLPDGFVQIGEGDCNETYLFTITVQVAYSLDLILPEVLVFNQNREKYFMSFRMFGITVKSKPFCRDLHANIPMNEKIVVRILSTQQTLQKYLSEYCQILVSFYCGHDQLGVTQLVVDNLIEADFEQKGYATTFEQKCFFKFPSCNGIIPTGSHSRQPHIEVETSLKRAEVRPKHVEQEKKISEEIVEGATAKVAGDEVRDNFDDIIEEDIEDVFEDPLKGNNATIVGVIDEVVELPSLIRIPVDHCGDDTESVCLEVHSPRPPVSASGDQKSNSKPFLSEWIENEIKEVHSLQIFENSVACSIQDAETSKSVETFLKNNVPALPTPRETPILFQHYCLDVILESISLKRHVKGSKLTFKFKHPKSSSQTTITTKIDNQIGEDIILENTRCKLFYISTYDDIRKMVYAWPPKLVLLDESGQSITEELDIYTAMFLSKNRYECSYVTEWKAVRTFEPMAKISIAMYLQEYGLNALTHDTGIELLPPMLDERIAILELQELQEWKDTQKVQFMANLRITEKKHLNDLQRDWFKKKKALESSLTRNVSRCQNLSQELQLAVDTIRTKKALEEKQKEFSGTIEPFTQKYDDCQNKDLVERIVKLEEENKCLKGIIKDQRAEIRQAKKTALTKEQTTSLLQQLRGLDEKFEDARKAKMYFKEQWKKAVREIHDLRSLDNKQIQQKIKYNKTELSQLSLDSFYQGDNADLAVASSASFPLESFKEFNWDPTSLTMEFSNSAQV